MKCKYNVKIFDQVIECLIEDCEQCRFNPNPTISQNVTDKYTEELLKEQSKEGEE